MNSGNRTTNDELINALRALGLMRTSEDLSDFIARATRGRWSPGQILEHMARAELQDRAKRSVERRLSRAHLGRFKPMSDFDWNWPKRIEREAVERVLSLDFLERAENVIIVASQGLGKTMIAKNLAHNAVLAGLGALFVTASDLLLDLNKQEGGRALERRLQLYTQFRLLVIDEVGYLSYDNRAADLIFQVVSRRYERRSLVVTTNLAFADWHTVFPNVACATALIDRLTHHSEILSIEGDSYRKREAEQIKKERRREH
jgi:DNA replication protein DnaC